LTQKTDRQRERKEAVRKEREDAVVREQIDSRTGYRE
jgi:hypothetical protein